VTFALKLQDSLRDRAARLPIEFAGGRSLEEVLSRHLQAVESMADTILLTSILLLDPDKKRLWHAAAPSLPQSYCEAINGVEIGPSAGSCGTAAFERHAIYVTDIATDPLWSHYRHLALPHGLRACWSTPIHNNRGVLVGTFAIYHLTPRSPTREEVNAIKLITRHVAQAIDWFRDAQDPGRYVVGQAFARATLPSVLEGDGCDEAGDSQSGDILRSMESDFEKLAHIIKRAIEALPDADPKGLRRAKKAAERGAAIARRALRRTGF